MRVYHFMEEKWALEGIEKKRLKISLIDDLNDPFELRAIASDHDPNLHHGLEASRSTIASSRGVLCFSRSWQNPLLWSHYADRHFGICLGFDVNERDAKVVRYVTRRARLTRAGNGSYVPTPAAAEDFLYSKSIHWKFEQEVRVWCTLEEPEPGGLHFYPWANGLQLREVICGVRCKVTAQDVRSRLDGRFGKVFVMKARLSKSSFRVVEDRDQRSAIPSIKTPE